jgi:hypothetical protein
MPEKGGKSIGELVSELTREVRMLLRQELELFSAEMKEKLVTVAKDAVAIGAGAILGYTGFLVLVAGIVLALATFMPAWAAALLVAAAIIATGFALALKGSKELTHLAKKPEQTAETLKETVKWAKSLRLGSRRRISFANKSGIRKGI